MEFYFPRKIMFRAWNKQTRLLMRLDNIGLIKGELVKNDHILLQFTGLRDKQDEELYEMDLTLIATERYIIQWSPDRSGWCYRQVTDPRIVQPLTAEVASTMVRLCSYFESSRE